MIRSLLLSLTVLALAAPSFADTSTWAIDTDHSNAQFKVQHMMISYVRGNLPEVTGTVQLDEQDMSKSMVEVTIAAASLDTNHAKRDAHLKSADFLDVEKYPTLTYKSKQVSAGADNTLKVLGDLTIRGVTKEVELTVYGPTPDMKDPWGNIRRGAQAATKINRKDFGLVWNKALETGGVVVGDDVEINIEIELIKQAG